MTIPQKVITWIEDAGCGSITASQPVSGGCINNGMRLVTSSGKTFFLKTNSRLPADTFEREAQGLEALHLPDAPRVPEPYLFGASFLLTEDMVPAPKKPNFWSVFGRQLAVLHQYTHTKFGFDHNNYIGATVQPNPWTADGYEFYTQARLVFQAQLAQRRGYFQEKEVRLVERLCLRLPDLVPLQPASILHGDLWSGNVISDEAGSPATIDPAVHYGWAEAELGMTALFGGFPETFYRAYAESSQLAPGWRERLPIYNLYHLLNHLNIFGAGYYSQCIDILRRYAG